MSEEVCGRGRVYYVCVKKFVAGEKRVICL